jgi:hypothetical protein
MGAFEDFWLNIRFRGQSVNEKYPHLSIEAKRALAIRAFEMWRRYKLVIDYENNKLERAAGIEPATNSLEG